MPTRGYNDVVKAGQDSGGAESPAPANDVTILPMASRSSGETLSIDVLRGSNKGVMLFLEITGVTGTSPTLNIKLQAKDPLSGGYSDLVPASFAQKTGTGRDHLVVYPGLVLMSTTNIPLPLPKTYRLSVSVGGSSSPTFTFSVHAEHIA